jgi:hypothetical protein
MSDESFMHAAGESHDCSVPAKAPNKDRQGLAEGPEGRRSIQEIPRHGPMLDTVPKNTGALQFRGSARRLKGMCVPISEIRTVCANERPHGSVRGVPGNRHPYRDPFPFLSHPSSAPLINTYDV